MTPINNKYSQYSLTEDEKVQGLYLSAEQRAVIQNNIADCAMIKDAIRLDASTPNGPIEYVQKIANLTGKIEILTAMLLQADNIEKLVEETAAMQAELTATPTHLHQAMFDEIFKGQNGPNQGE